MSRYTDLREKSVAVPGVLRDLLRREGEGLSERKLAARVGLPVQTLGAVLAGSRVSRKTVAVLSDYFEHDDRPAPHLEPVGQARPCFEWLRDEHRYTPAQVGEAVGLPSSTIEEIL